MKDKQFSNYFLYALGEIILVVVGILIALQINTWSENQSKKVQKNQTIEALLIDLREDSTNIKNTLRRIDSDLNALKNYQMRLTNKKSNLDTLTHIVKNEYQLYVVMLLNFNNNTFKSMISTGVINLFNNALKKKLFELDENVIRTQKILNTLVTNYTDRIWGFSDQFNLNTEHNLITEGPLYKKIWDNADKIKMLSHFNSIVLVKRDIYRVQKRDLNIIIKLNNDLIVSLTKELHENP